MTLKEMGQLNDLRREIEEERGRLRKLRAAAEGLNFNRGGMPSGGADRRGKEGIILQIGEIERIIREREVDCLRERVRLERIIAEAPDSHIRRILTKRFLEGKSWQKVAMEVHGGKGGAGTVLKMAKRYLERL